MTECLDESRNAGPSRCSRMRSRPRLEFNDCLPASNSPPTFSGVRSSGRGSPRVPEPASAETSPGTGPRPAASRHWREEGTSQGTPYLGCWHPDQSLSSTGLSDPTKASTPSFSERSVEEPLPLAREAVTRLLTVVPIARWATATKDGALILKVVHPVPHFYASPRTSSQTTLATWKGNHRLPAAGLPRAPVRSEPGLRSCAVESGNLGRGVEGRQSGLDSGRGAGRLLSARREGCSRECRMSLN